MSHSLDASEQARAPAPRSAILTHPLLAEPGSDLAAAATPAALHCANCLAPMSGHFCAQCGAPRLDERPLTVRRFARELWAEFTSVDSSTVRSFRTLLARPGQLTRAFLDGRTRWYLSPLRIYLLAFGLMVFARSFTAFDQQFDAKMREATARVAAQSEQRRAAASAATRAAATTVATTTAATTTAAPASRAAAVRPIRLADAMRPMQENIRQSMSNPWLRLVDPLVVGALLVMLYRKRRRNYAEHVLFALHVLAFNCLLSIVTFEMHELRSGLPSGFDAISVVHWVAFGTYFFLASRRVYGESARRTSAKTVVFVAGSQLAMLLVPFITATGTVLWFFAMSALQQR